MAIIIECGGRSQRGIRATRTSLLRAIAAFVRVAIDSGLDILFVFRPYPCVEANAFELTIPGCIRWSSLRYFFLGEAVDRYQLLARGSKSGVEEESPERLGRKKCTEKKEKRRQMYQRGWVQGLLVGQRLQKKTCFRRRGALVVEMLKLLRGRPNLGIERHTVVDARSRRCVLYDDLVASVSMLRSRQRTIPSLKTPPPGMLLVSCGTCRSPSRPGAWNERFMAAVSSTNNHRQLQVVPCIPKGLSAGHLLDRSKSTKRPGRLSKYRRRHWWLARNVDVRGPPQTSPPGRYLAHLVRSVGQPR